MGQVPQYYAEDSHFIIIDKETWEAVEFGIERRRNFALKYNVQNLEYDTTGNPFAGRVICGSCCQIFDWKAWNFTDDQLRRIIWRCNNGKYVKKGKKECDNRQIDGGL